jgi:hypothetical protein
MKEKMVTRGGAGDIMRYSDAADWYRTLRREDPLRLFRFVASINKFLNFKIDGESTFDPTFRSGI